MPTATLPSKALPSDAAVSSLPDSRPAPRLHFIDGLRGLAMLMVLLYHCWLCGGCWTLNLPLGTHRVNVAPALNLGHAGVNLFLVLSGFCLYWPFVKGGARREPTLWEFAKKRCRRILPPYYVTLLLFGLPPLLMALPRHDGVDVHYMLHWFLIHALMLHNLRPEYVWKINGSLWSLALEFQLYILFPVLVEAYRRFNARGVLLTVLLACTAWRFFFFQGRYVTNFLYGFVFPHSVFGRCFEFALGMFSALMVARWHTEQKSPLRPVDFLLLAAVFALGALDPEKGDYRPLTDAMWGLLFAVLLLAASRPGSLAHRALSQRALVSLGIFSYSVYLIHLPLVQWLGSYGSGRFSNTGTVLFMLFLVAPLMLGLGYVFHLVFERPFMAAPCAAAPAGTAVLTLAAAPKISVES